MPNVQDYTMRRGLLIAAVVGLTACSQPSGDSTPTAVSPSPSPAVSASASPPVSASPSLRASASPSPTASAASASANGFELATDSFATAPRSAAGGYLGNGIHGNALLAGSESTTGWLTWYWDGALWRPTSPSKPPSLISTPPVFDPLLSRSIALVGGASTGVPVGTWAWDGSNWSDVNAGIPFGTTALAFDSATDQLVALIGSYGGRTSTWLFDGHQWHQTADPGLPQDRSNSGFAYDPGSRKLVLFGAHNFRISGEPSVAVADTWTWDGQAWTQQHPQTNPPSGATGLAYDPDSRQLVLVVESVADMFSTPTAISMWSWAGGDWHQLSPHRMPAAGRNPSLTYDLANHQLLLFEGQLGGPGSQTWSYANNTWTRVG